MTALRFGVRRLGAAIRRRRAGGFVLQLLILAACWAYGSLCHPLQYSLQGIDSAQTIESQAWFHHAYADGVRLYVIHATKWGTCEPWPNTEKQLAMALRAGMKIAAYTRDPRCWRNGILAAGSYRNQLQFFAIDVETDPGLPVTADIVTGIKAMGVRPVVYSGSSMWRSVMGESAEFAELPLWDASATAMAPKKTAGNLLAPHPVQYGGWNTASNMRVGVQQAFEYTLHGVKVDLNSFSSAFFR